LSRSLLDFARLVDRFRPAPVISVSVTAAIQFNTTELSRPADALGGNIDIYFLSQQFEAANHQRADARQNFWATAKGNWGGRADAGSATTFYSGASPPALLMKSAARVREIVASTQNSFALDRGCRLAHRPVDDQALESQGAQAYGDKPSPSVVAIGFSDQLDLLGK